MTVTPDTKDWTWVLGRRCPECGFDASSISGREIPGLMRQVAELWHGALTRPQVAIRPSPERWSPLEYGCHVRDVLRIGDARLQLMLVQADPEFPNWDQDQTAIDADYGSQKTEAVMNGLAAAAARFTSDLDPLTPNDWERTGRRSNGAVFTVDTFVRYVAHDPVHHLADVGVKLD